MKLRLCVAAATFCALALLQLAAFRTAPLPFGSLQYLSWLGTAAAESTLAKATWRLYQNDRYGTTIDYPDFFRVEPRPDADDGRTFKSADGGKFLVYGSFALDSDLAELLDDALKNLKAGATVTYQAHRDNWFVISGTDGEDLFYERHLLSHRGEIVNSFVISYPAKLKQTYDPIVTRMAQSLRAGSGFQTPGKR
jgi:hypothetical protein